jgi:hypothetical protein
VEDAPPTGPGDFRFTRRLRLEPVGPANAPDLWLVHNDDGVFPWYDNKKSSLELSRPSVDDDWSQIYGLLPAEPWGREAHDISLPFIAHANWLEIGWVLRQQFWGRGYASEIGARRTDICTSACGTRARFGAAAWLKDSKGDRTTPRSLCVCCREETGTGSG